MTAERWQRIKSIFEEADSAPQDQRVSVLERLCGDDTDLRRQVEQMLQQDQGDSAFIQDAMAFHADALEQQANSSMPDRIGRYKIIRRIGQGGMGAVYEGVRIDDYLKKVAVKIIKQEFDSDFARTRFQQERQLLAVLEHPYIARLLDGGESESGSPYLVLELIDGVPISDYCETLDRDARLRLFLKVCEAVEYAHRNLIIHRDLKPGNILVTANGDPKLLDFGIAKLIDPSATLTQTSMVAMTPDYASPEQVRGSPISTASDVYSLGVILYQLLTGRKPYTLDSITPMEMDRVICQAAPDPPGLGNELDYILMMALRKEPERRYRSVYEFAQDIERYMTLRPVLARPDTALYRARKYIRRQWVAVAWASFAVIALLGGTFQAIRSGRRADTEAAAAKEVNAFLKNDLLLQASAFQQPDPHIEVKTALDRAAARIGNKFAGQPRVEGALRQTIGEAYQQLGLFAEARPHLEKAAALLESTLGKNARETLAAQGAISAVDWEQGKLKEAEARIVDVLARQRKSLGADDPDTLDSMGRLARDYVLQGKYLEAEKVTREVTERRTRVLGAEDDSTLSNETDLGVILYSQGRYAEAAELGERLMSVMDRRARVDHPARLTVVSNLAATYGELARYREAATMTEQLVSVRSKVMGPEHPDTLMDMNNLGFAYMNAGRFETAEATFSKLLEVRRRVLGPDHPQTLVALHNLGACYQNEGKSQLAIATTSAALEARKRTLGAAHPFTISSAAWLGHEYAYAGKFEEGERLELEALDSLTKALGPKHPDRLMTANRLATVYRLEGKWAQAEVTLEEVLAGLRAKLGEQDASTLLVAGNLAYAALTLGKPERAESLLRPVVEAYKTKLPDHWARFRSQAVLGAALSKGNAAEAETFLLGGYKGLVERRDSIPADSRFIVGKAGEWIVKLYQSTGRADKVAEWQAKLNAGAVRRASE